MPDNDANSNKSMITVVVIIATISGLGWMVWQAQASRTSALEDSQTSKTETLERLTNQRLALMEGRLVEAHEHASLSAHPVAVERQKALEAQIGAVKEMLQAQVDSMSREMAEDNKRELADAGNDDRVNEMLNEIETQFRNLFRFVQLLWQEQRGEPLPDNVGRG